MLKLAFLSAWLFLAALCPPLLAAGDTMNIQLHKAAAADDAAAIRTLLSKGAEIDASGATALLVATHGNRVNAARALIEAGADVNAKDQISDSPGSAGRRFSKRSSSAMGDRAM